MTRIELLWAAVADQAREHQAFLRVDDEHPLDLYAGIDHDGRRVLLLVTDREPLHLPPPGAVEVIVHTREDGAWAIIVQLARADLAELFGRLCQDLVETTRGATKHEGAAILLQRLQRWRRLLEPRHERVLSEQELRGLIGELWVLDTIVVPRLGPLAGVQAWLGPQGSPQDFLVDGALLEVKAVKPGSQTIPISSLEQLDAGTAPLWLGLVIVAPSTSASDGFTPAGLVARIHAALAPDERAGTEFALRLADAGYEEHASYATNEYRVHEVRCFRVTPDFPTLTRATVPAGVVDATYLVGIAACTVHACSFSDME